jgi:hypothetical protein
MRQKLLTLSVIAVAMVTMLVPTAVSAVSNSNLTQSITAGTLLTDVLDASRVPVGSPSIAMSAATFSFNCQTITGTLGSSSQRLYVTDPSTTSNGWTLAMAATGGASAKWQNSSATRQYYYNDATGSGCTNGQLTVDPSVGTVTADCVTSVCTGATVAKGSSTAMTSSTPVTLVTGAAATNVYRGYLTGVSLSQKIPAEQPADSYSLNMTLTVTAN